MILSIIIERHVFRASRSSCKNVIEFKLLEANYNHIPFRNYRIIFSFLGILNLEKMFHIILDYITFIECLHKTAIDDNGNQFNIYASIANYIVLDSLEFI